MLCLGGVHWSVTLWGSAWSVADKWAPGNKMYSHAKKSRKIFSDILNEVIWSKKNVFKVINSLAPRWFEYDSKNVIFVVLMIGLFKSCENVLRWMPWDLTDDKSALVQVMAWCRQATSHYLSQCWPRSISPYGVTRPQWVDNQGNCEKVMSNSAVSSVPADALAPSGSRTSAATAMI